MEVAGKLMIAVSNAPIPAKVREYLQFGVSASDLHVFDVGTSAALSHGLEAA
jgi:multiple sugar transport system ATP-binding protein